jgi:hypothetical protein
MDESFEGAGSELSSQQLDAVEWILVGETDAEVGALVGVSRYTVLRWRLHTPPFAEELERRRQERRAATREQAEATDRAALETVTAAIRGGSVPAALAYLRLRTVAPPDPATPGARDDVSTALLSRIVEAIRAEVGPEAAQRVGARLAAEETAGAG